MCAAARVIKECISCIQILSTGLGVNYRQAPILVRYILAAGKLPGIGNGAQTYPEKKQAHEKYTSSLYICFISIYLNHSCLLNPKV